MGTKMPVQPVGGRGRPIRRWEDALHHGGTVLDGRPRVFDAAGRMHQRLSGELELGETGLETIGRRAGIVRDGPARATGIPLKMRASWFRLLSMRATCRVR